MAGIDDDGRIGAGGSYADLVFYPPRLEAVMGDWGEVALLSGLAFAALLAIRRMSELLGYVIAAAVAMLTALAVWWSAAPP